MFNLDDCRVALLNILRGNMALKPGESVLLLNDVPSPGDWRLPAAGLQDQLIRSLMVRYAYDLYRESFAQNTIDYLVYPSTGQHGTEPPVDTAGLMPGYDVILAMTTYSISHTRGREEATAAGARFASMPGLQVPMLAADGPMAVDYSAVRAETERLAELITGAAAARIETARGTNLAFSLEGRAGRADTGILDQKGQFGNLPAGEAYTAPVEGTAAGTLVVPAGWHAGLDEDMKLEFTGGFVTAVNGGGRAGDNFRELLRLEDNSFRHRRNCAELGIGTNPKAADVINTLEAEKIRGTVHIAVGDSSHMGGSTESDIHMDLVIPEPTLHLDEQTVIRQGILQL